MTDIFDQITKFNELVNKANKILVTSHVSPDPDSVCSILLLGTALELNFPNKEILMTSEELPEDLSFVPHFEKLKKQPLSEAVEEVDLLILVDAMNIGRCTRGDFQQLTQLLKGRGAPIAVIDHHETVGVTDNDFYLNNKYSATVEEVYNFCFHQLSFEKPQGASEITMIGLYSDTAGFTYLTDRYQETLNLIAELISAGQSIERTKNKLNQYSLDNIKVLEELLRNVTTDNDYSYSYLSDEFVNDWVKNNKPLLDMHKGAKLFTDNFVRNIEGRQWGFIVYKDPLLGDSLYSVSLRSLNGVVDVSVIANNLSGGGHKPAAGGKVEAQNIQEAIAKVKEAIVKYRG